MDLLNILRITFGDLITDVSVFRGDTSVTIKRDGIVPVSRFLKDTEGLAFDFLSDCCGVDRFPETPRFWVVYHLYSTVHNHRLRIKVSLDDVEPAVDSVADIWRTADWHERECFDLFGILFRNHRDMRRILMPDDFEGYPLRKDFPLKGL